MTETVNSRNNNEGMEYMTGDFINLANQVKSVDQIFDENLQREKEAKAIRKANKKKFATINEEPTPTRVGQKKGSVPVITKTKNSIH